MTTTQEVVRTVSPADLHEMANSQPAGTLTALDLGKRVGFLSREKHEIVAVLKSVKHERGFDGEIQTWIQVTHETGWRWYGRISAADTVWSEISR